MDVSQIKYNHTTHIIRISNGPNGGLGFYVKISEGLNLTTLQAKIMLEKAAAILASAPYYKLIKGKAINVLIVSRADMENLGFFEPGECKNPNYASPEQTRHYFPIANYNPVLNLLLINGEVFGDTADIITHELLHAYSTEMIKNEGDDIHFRTGIMEVTEKAGVLKVMGKYLNEGLTEFLRVMAGGAPPAGSYGVLYRAINSLARKIGIQVLVDAYFKGEVTALKRAVDQFYGPDGYEKLAALANFAGSIDGGKRDIDCFIGFVEFGFEYFCMQGWGYSLENRARAPRKLLPNDLSAAFMKALEGTKVEVYTNLTEEELKLFFRNINDPESHTIYDYSYDGYINLKEVVAYEIKGGKNFLSIRHINKNRIELTSFSLDPKYWGSPHFLGHISEGARICEVQI